MGEYATVPMPSSSRTALVPLSSRSRLKSDISDCTAVSGCTAWARRIVAADTSDRPM